MLQPASALRLCCLADSCSEAWVSSDWKMPLPTHVCCLIEAIFSTHTRYSGLLPDVKMTSCTRTNLL